MNIDTECSRTKTVTTNETKQPSALEQVWPVEQMLEKRPRNLFIYFIMKVSFWYFDLMIYEFLFAGKLKPSKYVFVSVSK